MGLFNTGGQTMKRLAIVLGAALSALPALGDVVHLKNGGTLEGQVTVTQDGAVIKLPVGEIRVSNDAIARIEKKETPLDQYYKRAAAIKEDDAEAHYQLGLWAQGAGLKPLAKDEFAKTLALKPDHDGAHAALGHKKVDGKWLTEDQEMQAKGLVKRDGQWMTPAAAAKIDALKAELEAAREKRVAAEDELKKAQEQAGPPTYTYGGYYAPQAPSSYYPTWPYASSYPYTGYYPYTSYSYINPWPSHYWVRPYPYFGYSYWPRTSFYFGGGGHFGGHYSGHGGGHGGHGGHHH